MKGPRLLFATGGTGGHIYPALAVAQEAQRQGCEVTFLGQAGGMEASVVPAAGFTFIGVTAGKWHRGRPDPRQALAALGGIVEATVAVGKTAPDMVVGFGGFASFPGCVAGLLLRRPLLLYEGNALPGKVVRWLSRAATRVFLSERAAASKLPAGTRVELVPVPIREVRCERAEARRALDLPEEGTLTLVMGGSQGSLALNEAVPRVFRRLPPQSSLVLHSTGPAWYEAVRASTAGLEGYFPRPYLDATLAWSAADLAITRAGFSTLAEAAFHGTPLVMVPLPTAAEQHQHHNARAVEAGGAGRVVEQDDDEGLLQAWSQLLDADERRRAAAAARNRSDRDATRRFVERLVAHLPPASGPERRRGRA